MALRAAMLLYLLPTLMFGISCIFSWGDFGLFQGGLELVLFLVVDFLIIACMALTISRKAIFLTHLTFDDVHIKLVVYGGALVLTVFVMRNIGSYSLAGLAQFSELYRNAGFSGSGLYTALVLRVGPLLLAYDIFQRGLDKSMIGPLLVIVLCCLVLGFRVYLFPIILASIMVYFKRGNLKGLFACSFIGILVMVAFKIYLGYGTEDERSLIALALNPFLRIMPVFLLDEGLFLTEGYISCVLPVLNHFYDCDSETIKQVWFKSNATIGLGIPNIGKYSGVAYPLKLYFYNNLGAFGYLLISVVNLFAVLLLYLSLSSKSHVFRFAVFSFYVYLTAATLEDLFMFRSSDVVILVCLVLYFNSRVVVCKKITR
jgi:hypothetical protein